MKDLFAAIYETWFGLFEQEYYLIYNTLFDDGGYIKFGMIFIFLPLILWLLFYYGWKYPYGKIWHWLIWLLVIFIIVVGSTYGLANTEIFGSNNQALIAALENLGSGYENHAKTLPLKYALVNGLLASVFSFIYGLLLKQSSKIQTHLPF